MNMLKLTILMVFLAGNVCAADYCMMIGGTRTSGIPTSNVWTTDNCYASLQAAFSQMSGGDTLLIDDGTYSGGANTITQVMMPPNGSSGDPTVIKARNIPGQNGVTFATPLRVKLSGGIYTSNFPGGSGGGLENQFNSWIKIEGIKFGYQVSLYRNFNNWYFKQCAFQGERDDGNVTVTAFSGNNTLVEDSVIMGRGRYGLLFYDQTREIQSDGPLNQLARRVVIRQDWANRDITSPNPIAGAASYFSRGSVFQNVIVLDGDPEYWQELPGELAGSYYQPVDDGEHDLTMQGCVAVNNGYSFYTGSLPSTSNSIVNSYGAKLAGGMRISNATLSNIGLYNLATSNFAYRSSGQIDDVGLSANLLMSADSSNNTVTSVNQTNTPEVVHKFGVEGAFRGDSGWDTDLGTLWPYPLEAWVKAELASMDTVINGATMPSPTRGAASAGLQMDELTPTTVTSYIWEIDGTQMPSDIYGATPSTGIQITNTGTIEITPAVTGGISIGPVQ